MKRNGTAILLCIILSFLFIHTETVAAEKITVEVNHLNVRSGPGLEYERIGQIHSNETYEIITEKTRWVQIRWHNQTGWVAKWLTKGHTYNGKSFFSKVDHLRIRSKPGINGSVKGYLMKNDQVTPQARDGKWVSISHSNTVGWVHSDYLGTEKQEEKEQSQKVTGTVTVATPTLNVRTTNSMQGKVLAQVHKGAKYNYLSKQNGWYQIRLNNGRTGWVAEWLVKESTQSSSKTTSIQIQYNGTNLREGPSTNHKIIGRGNQGQEFDVLSRDGQWYKIRYQNGTAFVASWIVEEYTNEQSSTSSENTSNLNNKVIMIDPGHGGRDPGASGYSGSYEKTLTLQTAKKLRQHLESEGVKVLMTRTRDYYQSLSTRTYYSNTSNADIFISLHYNSAPAHLEASGISSYYYRSQDKALATSVQREMVDSTGLRNRNVHKGNFYVLRENHKPSLLLELGFISDPQEEKTLKGVYNQNQVSKGITQGLINYFSR